MCAGHRLLWPLGLAAALALTVVALPPLRAGAVAAATVADALDLPVTRPFAAEPERRATTVGGVDGDLYDVGGSAPAVLLVPGATPEGREDSRVIRLASALARSERAVFVPELRLYDEEVVLEDVDAIVRAAVALSGERRGPVLLVGTSFGGSLCLLAAADPRLEGHVARVATFGSYFELLGLLQAATTGVAVVDDRRIPWDADPRAEGVVRERLVGLLPQRQRPVVEAALDGGVDPADLPPEGRAIHALLTNRDPERTFELAEDLPPEIRERIAELSPSSVAHRLDLPISAMHSTDDPAVPYGELLRLGEALPHATLVTLDGFSHVDLQASSPRSWVAAVDDLWNVWRFATAIVRSQEGWLP